MTNVFRDLFRPSLVTDDGKPVPFIWVGDRHRTVCMNPHSSRVYATLWHDGYGKFYPTIYVSLFDACRIVLREPVASLRLRNFPRCAFELLRLKCRSMSDAQEGLQELLADLRII
jgi:hypothetical protein